MLLVTNYAKNYASKIYRSLRPIRKSRVLAVVGVKENVSASRAFFRSYQLLFHILFVPGRSSCSRTSKKQ